MKKTIIVLLLSVCHFSFASGQSWYWGKQGYSTSGFFGPYVQYEVVMDSNRNAYITGSYYSNIKFDTISLNSGSLSSYLVKYDSSGNALWAIQPIDSGTSNCFNLSAALDKSGNIFVTGYFNGTVTFGSYRLYGNSAFIVKYSPSGNVLWVRQSISGTGVSTSVATDDAGDAYITGYFNGKVSFGSDTINDTTLSYSVFLVKYDSAGNVLWTKQGIVPTTESSGLAFSLASDKTGNSYITGAFEDTLTLDSITLLSPKSPAAFIAKYSPTGNILWAKQSTNSTINSESWPYSIILTNTNNLYTTGLFVDAVKFGSQSLYSPSTNSAFLAKYDTAGNFVWAEQSSVGWYGLGLSSDNTNHIYLSGITNNNPDTLKFGNFQLYTSPSVSYASYLIKFDSSGKPLCGSMLNNIYTQGIASDPSGNYIYTTGVFYDTAICGSDTMVGGYGDNNTFTARWKNCPEEDVGINSISTGKFLTSVFPNPSTGVFTLQISNNEQGIKNIEVYNVLGEMVETECIPSLQTAFSIDLRSKPNGIYFYRVLSEDGTMLGNGKMVIDR